MFVAAWRFTTADREAFEAHYGPDGTWAQLFRRDPSYVRTDLLRDEGSYLTLDWWESRAAYERFRETYAADYAEIDRRCESVTSGEEKIGEFEMLSSS